MYRSLLVTLTFCLAGPFALILLPSHAGAQEFNSQLLDDYLDSLEQYDRAMGSLALSRGGKIIYARAIGYADAARTEFATPDHVYRVGSITKTFTAVILHRLAESGQLSLEDKLSKYYPDIPNADRITLEQMLRHTSGVANYTAVEDIEEWIGSYQSPEQLVATISGLTPDFAPGDDWNYSNSNYLLLGYIAESVSGKPYGQLLRDYVLKPSGLNNTYVGGKIDASKREVTSFQKANGEWREADAWDMSNAGAAGYISATAADLNTFYYNLLRGKLISPESLEAMKTMEYGYGHGLFPIPFGNKTGFGHNGGIEGFSTLSAYFPDDDISITYLANGVDLPQNDIVIAAMTIFSGLPFEIPNLAPVADLPVAEVEPFVGTYTADDFPLDVKVFVEKGKLMAQATGQGAFPLTPKAQNIFVFAPAGIRLEFDAEAKTMRLLQGGTNVLLHK